MPKLLCTNLTDRRFGRYGMSWPETLEVTHVDRSELVPPFSDTVRALIPDLDCMFVNVEDEVPRELIEGCPKLKLIQSIGASFHLIDYNAAAELGVMVCNTKGANATSVAEHAISLMLAAHKRIPYFDRRIREDSYLDAHNEFFTIKPRSLSALTIGLVGMGVIGKNVAKRLKGWDANVIYYDPYRPSPEVEAELGITYVDLPELFKQADCITIHLPVVPSTIGMVARPQLESMKEDAVLVNVSRGEIVVNEDIVWALENDQIGFYAADTIAPEPMPNDHPFKTMSDHAMRKIIFTPHIGGRTYDDFGRMLQMSYDNIMAACAGEMPRNIMNGVKELRR
ncbi:MAG: hypothetical protein IJH91_08870 [Mogibacterium sp.]|nr:hypothetical protein [Mogibacterium sp.]